MGTMNHGRDERCLSPSVLRKLADLDDDRTWLDERASTELRDPHLSRCSACRATFEGYVHAALDRRRQRTLAALLELEPERSSLVRLLVASRADHSACPPRWPEVEALGDYLTGHLPWQRAVRVLKWLLHDISSLPASSRQWTREFRQFSRERLGSLMAPLHAVMSTLLADNDADPPDPAPFDDLDGVEASLELVESGFWPAPPAASSVGDATPTSPRQPETSAPAPTSSETLRAFRKQANLALHDFLGDGLNVEVIRPLERSGWDGVAVYLPDVSGSSLEVVAASDSTSVYTVRHPIETKIPDVEVDVFRRGRAERMTHGRWDERFNKYLWETFHHERFHDRLFIPLVLLRSLRDCSVWTGGCRWVRVGESYWKPEHSAGVQAQLIGNLSLSRKALAPERTIARTLDFAGTFAAPLVHRASMVGLCERLLALLMKQFGARHGALHVGQDLNAVFENAGARGHGLVVRTNELGGVADAPRLDGIGAEAVDHKGIVHVEGPLLERRNRKLSSMGIRSTSAAPLAAANGELVGLVYLHYDQPKPRTDFSEYSEAIGHLLGAAMNVQRRAMMRMHVLAEAKGFARPAGESIEQRLERMAEFTLNLLGCDHVSLVATAQPSRTTVHAGRYITPAPSIEARRANVALNEALRAIEPPLQPVYVSSNVAAEPTFSRGRFAGDEEIQASALLPLRSEGHPVGFMIVDYRRAYDFGPDERLLETLASLLASGIAVLLRPQETAQVMEAALGKYAALEALIAADRGPQGSDVARSGFTWGEGWRTARP